MRALLPVILLSALVLVPLAAQPAAAVPEPVQCYPTFPGGTICFVRVGGSCLVAHFPPPEYGPPSVGKCPP